MVKIKRSFPAPQSLAIEKKKVKGSYREADVIERLAKDFNNKCYICELDKLQDPQVEHLRPHFGGKDIERKFDWNNLFWSCSHCNNVKNQRKYDDCIIDCCNSDPEERIYFRLQGGKTDIKAVNSMDYDAQMTSELVDEVFNLKNSGMRVYKSEYRFNELNVDQLAKEKNVKLNNDYVTDEEMRDAFINCDWAIVPYNSASQSGIIIDAYKYSRPVIAFAVGAIPEQVDADKSGYLVETGDNKKFADKLKEVMSMNKDEYYTMSRYAYQYGSKKYATGGAVERFVELLKK